jgi:NAD(P)-dependent dehydrogenase (short-subunit alcohol dehydrogenase family)
VPRAAISSTAARVENSGGPRLLTLDDESLLGGGRDAPGVRSERSTMSRSLDLRGKVAYITGGTTGVGLGIACACVESGMQVALGYIDRGTVGRALETLKRKGASRVLAVENDVRDREAWQRAIRQLRSELGGLHLLVCNAGIKTFVKATEASAEQWDETLATNVTGVWNGIHAALPWMKEHGEGGHIVATASMGGLLPGSTAGLYTTTKFAVVGLVEALRVELRNTAIGASVFCPGLIDITPFADGEDFTKPGMNAVEAGRRVLDGVQRNALYILSHSEFHFGVQQRAAVISESFDSETAPPERIAAESRVLRSPIFEEELTRLRGGELGQSPNAAHALHDALAAVDGKGVPRNE